MTRCVVCGARPTEPCNPKTHWVHDWIGIEFRDDRLSGTITYIKSPRHQAYAEARAITNPDELETRQ